MSDTVSIIGDVPVRLRRVKQARQALSQIGDGETTVHFTQACLNRFDLALPPKKKSSTSFSPQIIDDHFVEGGSAIDLHARPNQPDLGQP